MPSQYSTNKMACAMIRSGITIMFVIFSHYILSSSFITF